MFRFSVRQLLLATAFIAAGCFALLNASAWMAAALSCGVALGLSAAVLFAIYRDGERRAFWIGFSVLGWVYLFLCFGGFLSASSLNWHGNMTALLAGAVYDRAYASQAVPAVTYTSGMPPGYSVDTVSTTVVAPLTGPITFTPVAISTPAGPDREKFIIVAHALWTILVAACGGWLAAWLYATRTKVSGAA